MPASGHARGVAGPGRHLDFRGVTKFKFPERAVPEDRLPRNGAGKVLKGRLGAAIIAESEKV